VLVIVAAVEIGVGEDGLARDVVEGDVLGRELGRRRDHEAWRTRSGKVIAQRMACMPPRLPPITAAQADAEVVGQAGLGMDPVHHRDHRKIGAPGLAGGRVDRLRAGGAVAAAEVVHADDEEAIGVERAAGADDVVPPAERLVDFVRIGMAGDVVVAGQRVADQDGVRGVGVERAVGFIHQVVGRQLRTAAQWQRLVEMRDLGGDKANAPGSTRSHAPIIVFPAARRSCPLRRA
jgi:hypothetical protein